LPDRTAGPEEVLEERRLDAVFVDQQQKFVQVGAINAFRVVYQDRGQTHAIDLIFPFDLGASQQSCVPKKIVWGHGAACLRTASRLIFELLAGAGGSFVAAPRQFRRPWSGLANGFVLEPGGDIVIIHAPPFHDLATLCQDALPVLREIPEGLEGGVLE